MKNMLMMHTSILSSSYLMHVSYTAEVKEAIS